MGTSRQRLPGQGNSYGHSNQSRRKVDNRVDESIQHIFLAVAESTAETSVVFEDVVEPADDEPLHHDDHDKLDVVHVGGRSRQVVEPRKRDQTTNDKKYI